MKIWAYLAIVGVILSAFVGTFWVGDRHGASRVYLEQNSTQLELDKAWREEVKRMDIEREQLEVELAQEKNNIKVRTRTVTEKVVEYVKDDAQCNFTRGAVSLHNEAWDNNDREGLPKDRSLSEAEASEASTIGQQALIRKDIEYAEWCLTLEAQFDKMVNEAEILGY